jgi:hypothetical protein
LEINSKLIIPTTHPQSKISRLLPVTINFQ